MFLVGFFLTFTDLSPLSPSMTKEQADIYIEDIEAQAIVEAPCIAEPGFTLQAAVKGILREAVLRRHSARDGAAVTNSQATAGSFNIGQTIDTRVFGNGSLSKSETRKLKALCRASSGVGSGRKAFTVGPR